MSELSTPLQKLSQVLLWFPTTIWRWNTTSLLHCDFLTVGKVPVRLDYTRMKFITGWSICHVICKNPKKDWEYIFFLKIILVFPCIMRPTKNAALDPFINATSLLPGPNLEFRREIQGKTKKIIRKKISSPSFLEFLQIIWQIDQRSVNFILI